MLAAQEDIANRIVELAKRKDMTVYQTVNDILEQALRVEELGMSLGQVVDERWMLERAQETGFTFTIEQLLYRIVDEAFDSNREKLTEIWREMGHWYDLARDGTLVWKILPCKTQRTTRSLP